MQKKNKIMRYLKSLLIWVPVLFFSISIFWIVLLRWVPVWVTPLMVMRSIEYSGDETFDTKKRWVPIEEISPNMVMAVIASEDNRFMDHSGFDWVEIDNAIEASRKGRRLRGASTISQQTAKNVFLFPGRSWIRKALEVYFTFGIEMVWGKKRIMEVYLNVAEMGRGVYGAEAAARSIFGKGAKRLTQREAALIAATLPNPLKRRADRPTTYLSSRASKIEDLMRKVERPEWLTVKKTAKKR